MAGRVLILGVTGMLGQALAAEARRRGIAFVGAARSGAERSVDVTREEAVRALVAEVAPEVVVNTVAITDHDACETDPCAAYLCNARAVALIADACRDEGARLVQISTDQFYGGDGPRAHPEEAPVTRLPGEYARTKFAGEAFALRLPDALVLRTNITGLRGLAGQPTFIEWVYEKALRGEAFTLFDDYYCSTIDTPSFAEALFDLLETGARGLLNLASREVSSKKDFIVAAVAALTGRPPAYTAGSVRSLATPRAEAIGLDVTRAETLLGRRLPGRAEVARRLAEVWRSRPPHQPGPTT